MTTQAIQAYDALSLPVWGVCADTLKSLASNQAARAWLGYSASVLHSMTITDLRAEPEPARLLEQLRQLDTAHVGSKNAVPWLNGNYPQLALSLP